MNRIAATLACLVLVACTTAADRRVHAVKSGESVTLAPGESANVTDAGITVRLLRITEDSRCPSDTTCIWAGEVKVLFAIQAAQRASQVELSTRGGQDVGKVRMTVLGVEPPRLNSTPIAPQDYRVSLGISPALP